MRRLTTAFGLCLLPMIASATPPPDDFYVDVRDYLPQGYVTDGTVDYKEHIQKCFDRNTHVLFPGSDDPARPMIYGVTTGLNSKPMRRIRFGPNAILKRLPSLGVLLVLGPGTHLVGAVIDGNKYGHWPLLKDREVKQYAYTTGTAVTLTDQNMIRDCFVYHNAGIAFGAWGGGHHKIYRCRAESCGFLEALGDLGYWGAERASADGFYFDASRYNMVKDSEAVDCSRWGGVVTHHASFSSFVDFRGGNLHFSCYGFIDVESAGPGNSLVRCRSPNSDLSVQSYFQDAVGCVASRIYAEHASYPRFLGCTTTGGWFRLGEVRDDRFVTPGRLSPMLGHNRVFLGGPASDQSLTVICNDGRGVVSNNVLYGFDDGAERSTKMLLFGVAESHGTRQAWGQWEKPIEQLSRKPDYLRARMDFDFRKRFEIDGSARDAP